MAINKVEYGGNTLIDLTADTVTADKLLSGYTAHAANGEAITGTYAPSTDEVIEDLATALTDGWANVGSTAEGKTITLPEEVVGKYIILFTGANTTNRTVTGNCEVITHQNVLGQGSYYAHVFILKITGTSIKVNMSRWRWHVLDVNE